MNENNNDNRQAPPNRESNSSAYQQNFTNSEKSKSTVEAEFRSSQTYRTISNSSSQAADKIASGLGTAASALESFMHSVDRAINMNSNQNQGKSQSGGSVPPGVQYSSQYSRPLTPPVQPVPPRVHQRVPKAPRPPKIPKPSAYAGKAPQYAPTSGDGGNHNLKLIREPSMVKYYLTAAAAIIYAFSAPLYEPQHFIPFAIVVGAAFVISSLLFRGKKKYIEVPVVAPKAEPVKTGNSDVDKTIEEGNEYLRKLRAANDAIPDEALSESIERIERTSGGIFNFVAENPDRAAQIRKFMSYYLPTTMKLLDSYQRLSSQVVKGETITSTMQDIERMLYTVAGAFEKQLDSLFSEEAMDISTDISVFETMLRQEGYVKEETKESLQ